MRRARVLVMATLTTKTEETDYVVHSLAAHGVDAEVIDLSLITGQTRLSAADKVNAIGDTIDRAIDSVSQALDDGVNAVLGLGGGTGGEIALRVMRALPITFPKVLVTTLPFDPRGAIADASIVLVPTLADLAGLNATLREILENAAAMTAGLCATRRKARSCVLSPSIGITSLGATEGAIAPLVASLRDDGEECTVFHANGYGGAAFQRFAERGAFHTIIDLTPHELTRIHIAGAHVRMPNRFSAAGDRPRVVLPGALNFIGLGEKSMLPDHYLDRPHYAHSGFFTHVKLLPAEMVKVADQLVKSLNALTGPVALIVPMGGFSNQDRPGGAIEDPALRQVFLDRVRAGLNGDVPVLVTDDHIASPNVTDLILSTRNTLMSKEKATADV